MSLISPSKHAIVYTFVARIENIEIDEHHWILTLKIVKGALKSGRQRIYCSRMAAFASLDQSDLKSEQNQCVENFIGLDCTAHDIATIMTAEVACINIENQMDDCESRYQVGDKYKLRLAKFNQNIAKLKHGDHIFGIDWWNGNVVPYV